MAGKVLLYVGSAIITVWGVAHIVPTKSVVAGFGELSRDNRLIITMEWVAEGMALCFIGLLVLFLTIVEGPGNPASLFVYKFCAAMLLVMAAWTSLTGARTSIIPIRICPVVKSTVAVLFILGSSI